VGSNPTRFAIGATANFRCSPFLPYGDFFAQEHRAHRRRRLLLGREVQVGVDTGGGGEGAVAQPKLNLLHGDAINQQQTSASMPIDYNRDTTEFPINQDFSSQSAMIFRPKNGAKFWQGLLSYHVVGTKSQSKFVAQVCP